MQPLWPYKAVQVIEDVMQEGERKGYTGWEKESSSHHIHKAEEHLRNYFTKGGDDEDHLAHAFCRIMMAVAIERGMAGRGVK